MTASKQILNFTVGPRQVIAVYDLTKRRLVVRALIHNGERVDRTKTPELWAELRDDFLFLVTKQTYENRTFGDEREIDRK